MDLFQDLRSVSHLHRLTPLGLQDWGLPFSDMPCAGIKADKSFVHSGMPAMNPLRY